MAKKLLSWLLVVALLFSCCFVLLAACKPDDGPNDDPKDPVYYTVTFDVGDVASAAGVRTPDSQQVEEGGKAVQPTIDAWEGHTLAGWLNGTAKWDFSTDTVTKNITLTANWEVEVSNEKAQQYEKDLTWGEKGHLYIHYLRGAHLESEEGTLNDAKAPNYSGQIKSDVYSDWGLWVWPVSGDGRTFNPMKIDASGAVYDIDLTVAYRDAGWDSLNKTHKGLYVSYAESTRVGIQIFSQHSRVTGSGFWKNDGGDVFIDLSAALRSNGDYHWFVMQNAVGNGSAYFTGEEVNDPYAGLEPGSATSKRDVVSNMGNNTVYSQQPVAEGWEDNGVGYQIFIASFADSDGDGMGDLRGIIEKLDYLEDLGVDTLWLTPFQTSNSYHGYDIMDYFSVDPRFGTLDDYRELLYKAHQRGMKVLLDFVLNHTSISNPWFAKSQNLVKETITLPDGTKKEIDYRNFYNWQNEEYVSSITNKVERDQWFQDANGYYFYSSFGSSMPELNFDYQATRDAILEVALYWMSFGLDGFRLDAVKHIYMVNENDEHSSWIVEDKAYSFDMLKDVHFFREFNAKLKATYPNALLLGENFNGNPTYIAPLYSGMDSQFNFNWYYDTTTYLNQGSGGGIMNQYNSSQSSYRAVRADFIDGVFTSNHDVQRARDRVYDTSDNSVGVPRTAKYGDANWVKSEQLAKLYAALSLTVPGITWIYNGDELGMFGTKTANPAGDGDGHEDRWVRQPVKWTTALEDSSYNCYYLMGFNNYHIEWDPLNAQLHGVAEQQAEQDSIFNLYKALIAIRKENSALVRGTLDSSKTTDSVIYYTLKDATNEVVVIINISSKAQAVTAPSGTVLYGGISGGSAAAMSVNIYKVK